MKIASAVSTATTTVTTTLALACSGLTSGSYSSSSRSSSSSEERTDSSDGAHHPRQKNLKKIRGLVTKQPWWCHESSSSSWSSPSSSTTCSSSAPHSDGDDEGESDDTFTPAFSSLFFSTHQLDSSSKRASKRERGRASESEKGRALMSEQGASWAAETEQEASWSSTKRKKKKKSPSKRKWGNTHYHTTDALWTTRARPRWGMNLDYPPPVQLGLGEDFARECERSLTTAANMLWNAERGFVSTVAPETLDLPPRHENTSSPRTPDARSEDSGGLLRAACH